MTNGIWPEFGFKPGLPQCHSRALQHKFDFGLSHCIRSRHTGCGMRHLDTNISTGRDEFSRFITIHLLHARRSVLSLGIKTERIDFLQITNDFTESSQCLGIGTTPHRNGIKPTCPKVIQDNGISFTINTSVCKTMKDHRVQRDVLSEFGEFIAFNSFMSERLHIHHLSTLARVTIWILGQVSHQVFERFSFGP